MINEEKDKNPSKEQNDINNEKETNGKDELDEKFNGQKNETKNKIKFSGLSSTIYSSTFSNKSDCSIPETDSVQKSTNIFDSKNDSVEKNNNVILLRDDSQQQINKVIPLVDNIHLENDSIQKTKIDDSLNTQKSKLSFHNLTRNFIIQSFSDQKMTKMLQNLLMNEASKEDIESIVNELKGNFRNSMKNKNGNYFCSDLFQVCDQNQRLGIIKEISSKISEDCVDRFANHSLQTLIKFTSSEEEYKLILESFDKLNLLYACIDANGSYVIQQIIQHIPERFRKKFNLFYLEIISFISKKKYGVINAKLFCSCTKNDDIINQIVNIVTNDFINLITNEFGTYLIEHILELWWNKEEAIRLKKVIMNNFRNLYSNMGKREICELFLKNANYEEKKILINSLKLEMNNRNDIDLFHFILQPNNHARNDNNIIINNNYKQQTYRPFGVNNMNSNNYQFTYYPTYINNNQSMIPFQLPISLQNYNNNTLPNMNNSNNNYNNKNINTKQSYQSTNNNFRNQKTQRQDNKPPNNDSK